MISSQNKIKVMIASHNSLISAGIQAFIAMSGYDVKYMSFTNLNDTLSHDNSSDLYLILHHRLLKLPKYDSFQQFLIKFKGKIMVLGTNKMDVNFHKHLILPVDNEETIVAKLEDFFASNQIGATGIVNDVLSARETDILKEVALGYSNKEIADRLFISINTVITHRKNITDKLGIKTISGLTVYALMNNLINVNDVTL